MSGKPLKLVFGGSFLLHTNMSSWPVQIGLAINLNHVDCFYYSNGPDTLTAGLNTIALKPFVVLDITKSLYMILSMDNHFIGITRNNLGILLWFDNITRYVPYFELSVLKEF